MLPNSFYGFCTDSGQIALFMQPENSESLFLAVSINLQFHNASNGGFCPMCLMVNVIRT